MDGDAVNGTALDGGAVDEGDGLGWFWADESLHPASSPAPAIRNTRRLIVAVSPPPQTAQAGTTA
ncbi:hypothetical protein GCM10010530_27010 [Kribbella aluminosa]